MTKAIAGILVVVVVLAGCSAPEATENQPDTTVAPVAPSQPAEPVTPVAPFEPDTAQTQPAEPAIPSEPSEPEPVTDPPEVADSDHEQSGSGDGESNADSDDEFVLNQSRFLISGHASFILEATEPWDVLLSSVTNYLGIPETNEKFEIEYITPEVTGDIYLDDHGAIHSALNSAITLGTIPSTVNISGNLSLNTSEISALLLRNNRLPEVSLTILSVDGLSWPAPTSGRGSLLLNSRLRVNGVVKTVPWQVTATFYPDRMEIDGDIEITLSEHNWQLPDSQSISSFTVEAENTLTISPNITLAKQ